MNYVHARGLLEVIAQSCSVKKVLLKFRKIHKETHLPDSLFK